MLTGSGLTGRALTFVLAGGQGERLYPLTRDRAKPVVPLGGIYRLIDFTLSNCFNSGLKRINILTQYQCESLHAYVRRLTAQRPSRNRDESVFCLRPVRGKTYHGTADAVFQNLPLLVENPKADFVVILSADHVYKMDYKELVRFHVERGAEVTVAGVEYPVHAATQFGVLQTDSEGYAIDFEEKPDKPKTISTKSSDSLVSMGIYVFNTQILMDVLSDDARKNTGHDFGKDIFPSLVHNRHVSVFNFTRMGARLGSYWRDVGTLEAYYRVNMELLMSCYFDAYASAGWPLYGLDRPYGFGENAGSGEFVVDSVIPEGVSIGSGSHVIHSVLSPGVKIGSGSVVHNSILLHNVRVGAGVRIHRAILDENVHIADGVEIGFDMNINHQYGFVTASGIVVVPANAFCPAAADSTEFVGEDPFKTQARDKTSALPHSSSRSVAVKST